MAASLLCSLVVGIQPVICLNCLLVSLVLLRFGATISNSTCKSFKKSSQMVASRFTEPTPWSFFRSSSRLIRSVPYQVLCLGSSTRTTMGSALQCLASSAVSLTISMASCIFMVFIIVKERLLLSHTATPVFTPVSIPM